MKSLGIFISWKISPSPQVNDLTSLNCLKEAFSLSNNQEQDLFQTNKTTGEVTSSFKWKIEYWTSLVASIGGKIYAGILADAGSSILLTVFLRDNSPKDFSIPELKFEDILVQINKLDKTTTGLSKFQEVNITYDQCNASQKKITKTEVKIKEEGHHKSFSELELSNHSKHIGHFRQVGSQTDKKQHDEAAAAL